MARILFRCFVADVTSDERIKQEAIMLEITDEYKITCKAKICIDKICDIVTQPPKLVKLIFLGHQKQIFNYKTFN